MGPELVEVDEALLVDADVIALLELVEALLVLVDDEALDVDITVVVVLVELPGKHWLYPLYH